MRAAEPTDWKIEKFSGERKTIVLDRSFSAEAMERIRLGLIPQQMEDKWFIYWKDESLFFHRSWTGFGVYIVHFVSEGDGCRMISCELNRQLQQDGVPNDDKDAQMISYLIDVLLLHQTRDYPSKGGLPHEHALQAWGNIGRAMFGQYPNEDSEERIQAIPSDHPIAEAVGGKKSVAFKKKSDEKKRLAAKLLPGKYPK